MLGQKSVNLLVGMLNLLIINKIQALTDKKTIC